MKLRTTLIAAALLALIAQSCDDSGPTAPESLPAAASAAVTVQICASASSSCQDLPGALQLGESMTVYLLVTSTTEPAPSEVGISTTLGNFGADGGGNPITRQTLALTGDSSSLSAQVSFNAGETAGTASLAANVGNVTDSDSVLLTESPALFLQSVVPNVGAATGGNVVTVSGQGFVAGTRVAFGGVQADPPSRITATSIVVQVPPPATPVATGSTLVVDVTVTTPPESSSTAAVSDTLPQAYTYARGGVSSGPAITAVVPGSGQNSGGTAVTITGSNFPDASAPDFAEIFVAFGMGDDVSSFSGLQVVPDSVSATEITLTTLPAGPTLQNQTVDVLVRDQTTGLSTLALNAFTYGTQDVVLDIQPRELSYFGSQSCTAGTGDDCVTITAQGLPEDMPMVAVEFGGVFQTTCSSSSTASCAVSFGANTTTLVVTARGVTVQSCSPPSGGVTLIDQQTGETSTGPIFSYTADRPIVTGASPASGAQGGGDTVTVQGSFSTAESVVVRLGGVQATVTSTTASAITISTPAFTGTFNQVACGSNGVQQVPTSVDVEVLYTGSGCSDTASGAFTYQPDSTTCVESAPPAANFTFTVDDSTLSVQFTDQSTGDPTAWLWSFGDGSTSSEQNPSHTYAAADVYDVTLQASNAGGTGSVTLQVTVGSAPVADFTFVTGVSVSPSPPCAESLFVQFTDQSTGDPTSWSWDFGDGESSTEQNPEHCYASAGMRTVTLTASNALGSSSASKIVTVTE